MELHDLKLSFQHHFRDGLVTVVGSGLSCAEGIPGMGDLAAHFSTTFGAKLPGDVEEEWKLLLPLISKKGLEAALHEKPPTPKLEAKIVESTGELIAQRERDILANVFSNKRVLPFSRLLKHMLKPTTGIPVVTTNYDRLIEVAVEEAGLGVDTLFVGHFAGELNEKESRLSFFREATLRGRNVQYRFRDRVNVFKPHGSLDWYYREGKPVRHPGDLALPRLIITPGINKLRRGYESPFDRHRERANDAIDKARQILVLGYGFNDDHLETYLRNRIMSGTPTLILTRNLSEKALQFARQYANVTAVQQASSAGRSGSSVFLGTKESFLADLAIWDLDCFIAEVLEP